MMKSLRIQLSDYKVPSWNTYYAGAHWSKRKEEVDTIHELVKWTVYQIKNKPELPFKRPVDILYNIHYKANRRRDPDNCTVKFICDGLVIAGVLVDDSSKEINSITIKVSIGEKDFVNILIQEI